MFLGKADEIKKLNLVNRCKEKTWLCMKSVREINEFIAKPFTHICNLSIRNSQFHVIIPDSSILDPVLKKLHLISELDVRKVWLNWETRCLKTGINWEFNSFRLEITCGVPQGSVLVLELFILYSNDILRVLKVLKSISFADDVQIMFGHNDSGVHDTYFRKKSRK